MGTVRHIISAPPDIYETMQPAQETILKFPADTDWAEILAAEIQSPEFDRIQQHYEEAVGRGAQIYPAADRIFRAYQLSPFADTRVVILGQDPYHREGWADGLAFSVSRSTTIPPSLRNIYKELREDLGIDPPTHGDLSGWAEQGVLLLNTYLTVEDRQPASHRSWGWDWFTDATISQLSELRDHLVFMLWGQHAMSKKKLIDKEKHLIIEAAHPSPLARGAYFGSRPFSQADAYLVAHGMSAIEWENLP